MFLYFSNIDLLCVIRFANLEGTISIIETNVRCRDSFNICDVNCAVSVRSERWNMCFNWRRHVSTLHIRSRHCFYLAWIHITIKIRTLFWIKNNAHYIITWPNRWLMIYIIYQYFCRCSGSICILCIFRCTKIIKQLLSWNNVNSVVIRWMPDRATLAVLSEQ